MATSSSDLELLCRYEALAQKYLEMFKPLAKQLEEFGRVRNELQHLTVELKERKITIPDVKPDAKTADSTP